MTFIVGFKCKNGLVLAADSLEGDGYSRKIVKKLEIFHKDNWGICWGIAGPSRQADKFSDKFKESLDDTKTYDRGKIEATMELCLKLVEKRYPSETGIEAVAGIFGPRRKTVDLEWLLVRGDSRSACVSLQESNCCTGSGDNSLANFILSNNDMRAARTFQAQHMAVFVTALMCEYADRIGKPIKVWTFSTKQPRWMPMSYQEVKKCEKDFSVEAFELAFFRYWESSEQRYYRQWYDEENEEAIARQKTAGGKDKAPAKNT